MLVNDRNNADIQLLLENMSTEEIEELLTRDFSAQEGSALDVEFIMKAMKIISERVESTAEEQEKIDEEWKCFVDSI